jgi:hypothetical protein
MIPQQIAKLLDVEVEALLMSCTCPFPLFIVPGIVLFKHFKNLYLNSAIIIGHKS